MLIQISGQRPSTTTSIRLCRVPALLQVYVPVFEVSLPTPLFQETESAIAIDQQAPLSHFQPLMALQVLWLNVQVTWNSLPVRFPHAECTTRQKSNQRAGLAETFWGMNCALFTTIWLFLYTVLVVEGSNIIIDLCVPTYQGILSVSM